MAMTVKTEKGRDKDRKKLACTGMSTYEHFFILSLSVIWSLCRDYKHTVVCVHSTHAHLRKFHVIALTTI